MENQEQKPKQNPVNQWALASLAMEMGFIIALPLLALGFAGKWLDSKYGTEPWIALIGVFVAIAATTFWLSRRIKKLIK